MWGFNSPDHATIQTDAGGFATNQTVNCGSFTHRRDVVLPAGYYYLNGATCNEQFKQDEEAAFILSPIVLPFLLALLIFGGPAIVILCMGFIGAPGGVVGSMTEVSPGRFHLRLWK